MRRQLALQLLQTSLPEFADESEAANLLRELQFLAEYKYNKYEMYHPGRQFLENLYLWLQQFSKEHRSEAIRFIREDLIFISRTEFQQLAQILYHDRIRRHQFEVASRLAGMPVFRVRAIRESPEFQQVTRSSLFVGMSDGARIDYVRRHNLDIDNEQVVPYYRVAADKVTELLRDLQKRSNANSDCRFRCLFLIDDFCGSGKTLLRETVTVAIEGFCATPRIPQEWRSRLRFSEERNSLELLYQGELDMTASQSLLAMGEGDAYKRAIEQLVIKSNARDTKVKGALTRVAEDLDLALDPKATICFCPLLITEQALKRLQALVTRMPGKFAGTVILPGAVLGRETQITSPAQRMGALCEEHYTELLEDEHTGSVKYGLESCGLPLVLHHNTPNNSIYLLWARKNPAFNPLFVRYERHGREGA